MDHHEAPHPTRAHEDLWSLQKDGFADELFRCFMDISSVDGDHHTFSGGSSV